MVASTVRQFGRLDVLVNNAAIFSTIAMKPFWELTVPEWDRLMAVNVRGLWLASKAVVPQMRASATSGSPSTASRPARCTPRSRARR
jgi:3-oxoacyl-[acyl-carrier protein] reductase